MYTEAECHDSDKDSGSSEEKTLTIKGLTF
jgi:hypothetical protein